MCFFNKSVSIHGACMVLDTILIVTTLEFMAVNLQGRG